MGCRRICAGTSNIAAQYMTLVSGVVARGQKWVSQFTVNSAQFAGRGIRAGSQRTGNADPSTRALAQDDKPNWIAGVNQIGSSGHVAVVVAGVCRWPSLQWVSPCSSSMTSQFSCSNWIVVWRDIEVVLEDVPGSLSRMAALSDGGMSGMVTWQAMARDCEPRDQMWRSWTLRTPGTPSACLPGYDLGRRCGACPQAVC